MKFIVVTGMPAAGKNIAARYAQAHQYPHFSTGDFVRAEIRKLEAWEIPRHRLKYPHS
jgi:dephospho-CoA kinase